MCLKLFVLLAVITTSSLYSNRAGMRKRLAELGFMADIQDTRKCKVAGHHLQHDVHGFVGIF
jgi:hypothetical protein